MISNVARHLLLALASTLAASSLGCAEKTAGSCDWRGQGEDRCFDFTDTSAKKDCINGRVWSDKPCDKTGSIGGCTTTSGTTKWLYAGTKFKTRADAGTECTTWLDAK